MISALHHHLRLKSVVKSLWPKNLEETDELGGLRILVYFGSYLNTGKPAEILHQSGNTLKKHGRLGEVHDRVPHVIIIGILYWFLKCPHNRV